jgi:hypothetical protein
LRKNPFPKEPQNNGQLVPVVTAQGAHDGVMHCVSPTLRAVVMPSAKECGSTSLYQAIGADYRGVRRRVDARLRLHVVKDA